MNSQHRQSRRPALTLLIVALLALSLAACSTLEVGIEPTPTPGAAPMATTAPTDAPPATAMPEPTAEPSPTSAGVTRVNVYLVALDDGGRAGKPIGCGDSIVAVPREIAPTHEPLRAVYDEQLAIRDRNYGESGLYNALYGCDLHVEHVSLVDGVATVELAGTFQLGGTCDMPRAGAQLSEPALQFATVQSVQVFVNGQPLDELLSLK